MVLKCWRPSATDSVRRALRFGLSSMLFSVFSVSAHARVSPAAPGDPGKPGGTPARSVTFGIGASDSVFAPGGRYRVLYDRRGDHRFRVVAVERPRAWSSAIGGNYAQSQLSCPGPVSTTSGGTAGYVPVFSGSGTTCDIEKSSSTAPIYQAGSGDVGIGTSTPTHTLDVQSGGTSLTELHVSNTASSDNSFGVVATAANGGIVNEVVASSPSSGPVQGIVGTSSNHPLAIQTNNTTRMYFDTGGNVAIAGPSPWIDVTAPPYSADSSGSSDATGAINSAIAACPQVPSGNSNGCTIFFPPGKYKIATSSGIQITQNNAGVRLVGAGAVNSATPAAASEILNYVSGAHYLVNVAYTGSTPANVNGVQISNLGFVDNTPGSSTGGGILLHDAQYFSIDGVSCSGFTAGACIAMEGDNVSGTLVYTQFGSIKDLFSQGLYGITAVSSGTTGVPIISEVTILGGNISCLSGTSALSGSVGINFDGTSGHIGENQIFGAAVNDCTTGYVFKNAAATHLVAKFECDTAGMTNCGTDGLLMDNPDTSTSYTNGNVITLQVSKASVGIEIDATNTGTAPANEQVVGGTFLGNTVADICINSTSLPTAMVLVPVAALQSGKTCPTAASNAITGSQVPNSISLVSVNGTTDMTTSWTAAPVSGTAPPAALCNASTVGSLYSNTTSGTGVVTFWVCKQPAGWSSIK